LRVVKEPAQPSRQSWKKAAVEKEELFSKDGSYPYSVCLGSFKTRDRLERAITTYREKGLSTYWVKVEFGDKEVWFRVFSGYFERRKHANEFIEGKNIKGALSRHTKYASLIGTYKSQEKLNRKKSAILELGYCPYIIHGSNGESRLYTGAFYQKSRAEKHSADLASDGIQSQVVER
jgi:cell division septation protein DedD